MVTRSIGDTGSSYDTLSRIHHTSNVGITRKVGTDGFVHRGLDQTRMSIGCLFYEKRESGEVLPSGKVKRLRRTHL